MDITPEDIETCETHELNYVAGELCPYCYPDQHENRAIRDKEDWTNNLGRDD